MALQVAANSGKLAGWEASIWALPCVLAKLSEIVLPALSRKREALWSFLEEMEASRDARLFEVEASQVTLEERMIAYGQEGHPPSHRPSRELSDESADGA